METARPSVPAPLKFTERQRKEKDCGCGLSPSSSPRSTPAPEFISISCSRQIYFVISNLTTAKKFQSRSWQRPTAPSTTFQESHRGLSLCVVQEQQTVVCKRRSCILNNSFPTPLFFFQSFLNSTSFPYTAGRHLKMQRETPPPRKHKTIDTFHRRYCRDGRNVKHSMWKVLIRCYCCVAPCWSANHCGDHMMSGIYEQSAFDVVSQTLQ